MLTDSQVNHFKPHSGATPVVDDEPLVVVPASLFTTLGLRQLIEQKTVICNIQQVSGRAIAKHCMD
jgi:hypothetical protein